MNCSVTPKISQTSINNKFNPQKSQQISFGLKTIEPVMDRASLASTFVSAKEFAASFDNLRGQIEQRLPENLVALFSGDVKKTFSFLGQFAQFCQPHNSNFFDGASIFKLKLNSGDDLTVRTLGHGRYGRGFKLIPKEGEPNFLKAFYDTNSELSDVNYKHGAIAENRTGFCLSTEHYSDLVDWHAGDIQDYKSWMLSEFLDRMNPIKARQGRKLREARPELKLEDGATTRKKKKNNMGGIRYDLGGIYKEKEKLTPISSKIMYYFHNPQELDSKKYYEILFNPRIKGKTFINKLIGSLPEKDRYECFLATLNHPDAQIRQNINSAIAVLPRHQRLSAMYELMKHSDPAVRRGMGEQTFHLAWSEKRPIVSDILNSTESESQYGLSSDMRWLLQDEQKDLLNRLFEKQFPSFRVEI